MVSDSTLQLIFKKLPVSCRIEEMIVGIFPFFLLSKRKPPVFH